MSRCRKSPITSAYYVQLMNGSPK